jgi:hypothetical protein
MHFMQELEAMVVVVAKKKNSYLANNQTLVLQLVNSLTEIS